LPRKSRKNTTTTEPKPLPNSPYKVGLYARLSVGDAIETQIALLRQYVSEQTDMIEAGLYQDIAQTGTNFNRPGFIKLLDDIKAKKINCIVVKDLSRFGRNYIETGNYLECVFPFMGVRFVAIGDNYDSNYPSTGDDLMLPLKNLINEVYAKDISKKVRSQYEMKRKRGEFCGTFAPYGYIKQGNVLVVDDYAARVVKQIFRLVLEGHSTHAIAAFLNESKILPPNRHRYEQGLLKGEKHSKCKQWYKSVVKRIIQNPTYTGRLEQGKYRIEDTHPAIIDDATFESVQKLRTYTFCVKT